MGWIYAIGPSTGGAVKIGMVHRGTIAKRLSHLQIGHPQQLVLIAQAEHPNPQPQEIRIHYGLGAHRIRWDENDFRRREWFLRTPEVETFIEILRGVQTPEDLETYVERLLGEVRCDLCLMAIDLQAPIRAAGGVG
ncbi:MAG: GIY-YIG nuclease family protein, partial [Vicinamibacterales bacterium]